MGIDLNTLIGTSAAAITALSILYAGYRQITHSFASKRALERESILKIAKEEMAKIEAELEEKIKRLEIELEAQKMNVSRDLDHLREIYNAEIKALGEKIDDLRSDLSDQHSSMVALLTKLVNSR